MLRFMKMDIDFDDEDDVEMAKWMWNDFLGAMMQCKDWSPKIKCRVPMHQATARMDDTVKIFTDSTKEDYPHTRELPKVGQRVMTIDKVVEDEQLVSKEEQFHRSLRIGSISHVK